MTPSETSNAVCEIRTLYRREGDCCTGQFEMRASSGTIETHPFLRVPFKRLICLLSDHLKKYLDVLLVFQRTDRTGLLPIVLGDDMRNLIREDMVAAIKVMNWDNHHVVDLSKMREKKGTKSAAVLFRAGHDTLAEAFGDVVYCRRNEKNGVECPCCGRWAKFLPATLISHGTLACDKCHRDLVIQESPDGWVTLKTSDLLHTCCLRYYLPRVWNPSRGWINRAALLELVETWAREKMS